MPENDVARTMQDLLDDVREELDEAVDPDTNFWSDAFLLRRLNRGLRKITQYARETRENWFIRSLATTDAPLVIHGRVFDPASMVITSGTREIALPRDFLEMRYMEPIVDATVDATTPTISFEWTNISSGTFRQFRREEGGEEYRQNFLVELVWRLDGPKVLIAPEANVTSNIDFRMDYVFAPQKNYVAADSLENSGFTENMLDAAIAYAVYQARRKEENEKQVRSAREDWLEKVDIVTREAGPRQTVEGTVVNGYMEDERD